MQLIHLEIELDNVEEFSSYSISQQLYKELTGRTPYVVEEATEPGVIIRSRKKKLWINWETDSCRVAIESIANPERCFEEMTAIIDTINKIAPIGELSKRHLITYWLLPVENYSFFALERKYRDVFLKQQPIWNDVFDSSVIIDTKINKLVLHHQSGAMGLKQLRKDYSVFKLENIPKVFLFLWAGIYSDKVIKYAK